MSKKIDLEKIRFESLLERLDRLEENVEESNQFNGFFWTIAIFFILNMLIALITSSFAFVGFAVLFLCIDIILIVIRRKK